MVPKPSSLQRLACQHRTSNVNEKTNDQKLRLDLDLLEERREIAAIREAKYKQRVEKYYNKKVRHVQFKVGEFVLRKNEVSWAANTGKLGPTWEGPYKAYGYVKTPTKYNNIWFNPETAKVKRYGLVKLTKNSAT
ncbi:hypothetical protein Tco_1165405 [Tanacetum coccineum]